MYSACTASGLVIEAVLEAALENGTSALVEATSNQSNQFGGYTGMTPADFSAFVRCTAERVGFAPENLILGGDHLGPLTWQGEPESAAMEKAETLVRAYVEAGFTKIHIDTSMRLADDDPQAPLSDETIARRAVRLVAAAESAYSAAQGLGARGANTAGGAGMARGASRQPAYTLPAHVKPVYIIGSEVPIPGGAKSGGEIPDEASYKTSDKTSDKMFAEKSGKALDKMFAEKSDKAGGHHVAVTSPEAFESTYGTFRAEFESAGMGGVFSRVVGVVVQPGVEFGDDSIDEYDRGAAAGLAARLAEVGSGDIVFEGHSTDYQPPRKLRQMVEDGIAILKVGPALTFYLREAAFALSCIEEEIGVPEPSCFKAALEEAMLADPANWEKYYSGTDAERAFKRRYSLSDRSRYYFPCAGVQAALARLMQNIDNADVPVSLLSQYLPTAYARLRDKGSRAPFTAAALMKARVRDCIDDYLYATGVLR
jgi:D-tagatose-1,6-bisphosphate aldolase subunit GatZ/KbaZ